MHHRLIIGALAALPLLTGTPALAADMALKAPPPAAVYSWTGWYLGLNVGGSFGEKRITSSYGIGGVPFASTSAHLDGVIGGGQIGYNWQSGHWLFGLEADFQGSSERATADPSAELVVVPPPVLPPVVPPPVPMPGELQDREKLEWFGTLRGRLGVLASPTWLLYVTGGIAYGGINSNEMLTVADVAVGTNFNTIRAGWTLGGGIEGALGNNWSAKLEYLYMDLGSFSNTFTGIGVFNPMALTAHITDNIVRVGVNYNFH
jgi:outer membrane immunogenic protein